MQGLATRSQLMSLLTGFICLLANINILAKSPQLPIPAADEFHFVVLGDSQFHQPVTFNRIINDVARMQPAFAVQVGDMVTGYNSAEMVAPEWQRFRDQIAPLATTTYVPVPGNHDVYGPNKTPDRAVTKLYRQQWGPDYHSFRYRNSAFLILNTDVVGAANSIQGKQLRWLAKALAATQDATHRFVFLHRPPALLKNAAAVHQLFAKHNVDFVFYGHHHHLHHQQKDGVTYIMTNAAANSGVEAAAAGSFPHFLHVSVRDAQARVAVVKADAIVDADQYSPWDNYDLFALTGNLAPTEVMLQPIAKERSVPTYEIRIPLTNNSRRDVQIFPSCRSADDRWHFTPQRLAPITLAAKGSYELVLQAEQDLPGSTESLPQCHLDMPFQTNTGTWLQHQVLVNTKRQL